MRLLAPVFLIFLFASLSNAIVINEIMHNPLGSDSEKEWIEIYNNDNQTYNITGWKLNTGNTDHTLNVPPANDGKGTMIFAPDEYIIIAQNATFFTNNYSFNGSVIDSSWSDLSNSANETVLVKNSTSIFNNITYPPASEGSTACMINNSFVECVPTPGLANLQNQTYNVNASSNQSSLCNLYIAVKSPDVYNTSLVDFDLFLNDTTCAGIAHNATVSYAIQDLFGNTIKPFLNTTREFSCSSTINRQWTAEDIAGSDAYNIIANITDTGCNDSDVENNKATKLIVVRGTFFATRINNSVNITSVDVGADNEIKYGETARIELEVYRGNTSKYAVDVWVQDSNKTKLSEVTTINVNSKFTSYKFMVPILMKANCDRNFADDLYTIVADGLDSNTTKLINVKGVSSLACKTITIGSVSADSGGSGVTPSGIGISLPYEAISYPDHIYVGQRFFVILRLFNNESAEKNFSVYSYVYRNNTPVSLGFGNGRWLGSWDANKRNIKLLPNESVIVNLESQIENTTEPGKYILNVRVQVDKDYDFKRDLDVVSQPHLMVTKDGKSINLETDCIDCSILVLPEDIIFNTTSASIEASVGRHSIMLLVGDAILEKVSIDVDDRDRGSETNNIVTGSATKMNFIFDIHAVAKAFVLVFIQKFA